MKVSRPSVESARTAASIPGLAGPGDEQATTLGKKPTTKSTLRPPCFSLPFLITSTV